MNIKAYDHAIARFLLALLFAYLAFLLGTAAGEFLGREGISKFWFIPALLTGFLFSLCSVVCLFGGRR